MNISTLTLLILVACPLLQAQSPDFKPYLGDLSARSIGPAVMSGRVTCLTASPHDAKFVYVGAANGGVWKSDDGGATFSPVFDDHPQCIGALTISPSHPDTIWVGTGESWVRNSVSIGTGIYLSTDQGISWKRKGLENSERIARICVHPTQPQLLYAAVQGALWNDSEVRGVYRSQDFGKTWERVLYVNAATGCADLAMDPARPQVLYAAMWQHRRSPDFFKSGGEGSGLYKSEDGGSTWRKIHNGFPKGDIGRIGIGIAPSASDTVYISLEAEAKGKSGMYRSHDGGENWEMTNDGFGSKVRPFYFSRVVVDPQDPKKVFKCGVNLSVSKDGAETFATVISNVHSDIHDVWINPHQSDHVIIGTDGGAYRSLDGGSTFEMFMNLPLSQFYTLQVDQQEPYQVYGGLQDNGSWVGPSRSVGGISNSDWSLLYGGDGFHVVPHPNDPNIIYAESQGGNLVRHDAATGQSKDIRPVGNGDTVLRFNWNTPIYMSPTNPERLYVGSQYLHISENRGESWQRISPDLTTNDPQRQRQRQSGGISIDNSTAENNTTLYAIAESPLNEQLLYVGTDDGLLHRSTDAGNHWQEITPPVPQGLWVSSIEASRHDMQTAYVTIDGHRSGDQRPYVFVTRDTGNTWQSLATDDIPIYAHVIREDPVSPHILFLGTEFGLYISMNGGNNWQLFDKGIPQSSVRALVVHPTAHDLVIATHGRGLYIIDDLELLRQVTPEVAKSSFHFLEVPVGRIYLNRYRTWFGGMGNFVGSNPDRRPYISYYMKRKHLFGDMKIDIYDPTGVHIREMSSGKNAGINIVPISVALPLPKAAPTRNRSALFGSVNAPTLPDGDYRIVVTKGKDTFATVLTLAPEEGTPYTDAERQEQNRILTELYDMTNRIGYAYYTLEDIETQAQERAKMVQQRKLSAKLISLAEEAANLRNSLVAMEGDMYVNESSELREEVSELYRKVGQYPGRPSNTQKVQIESLRLSMQQMDAKFTSLTNRIASLNARLQKASLPHIAWQSFEDYLQ